MSHNFLCQSISVIYSELKQKDTEKVAKIRKTTEESFVCLFLMVVSRLEA